MFFFLHLFRFIGGNPEEHFYKASYRTDVPADGLAHFAEHVWVTTTYYRRMEMEERARRKEREDERLDAMKGTERKEMRG